MLPPPKVLGRNERENIHETQTPSRIPANVGFLPGRMEWDRVPHAERKSKDLTHQVLSQGLNQSSVSALEAAADTSLACGSPALITAFWTHFLFGSWQGPLRGATNNEQLTTEPPSMGH